MIKFVTGNMFNNSYDMRVNTVNCVGVMGAGVALAFKKMYPPMFAAYQRECWAGRMEIGKMFVWKSLIGEEVVNFPTKRHWRGSSEYLYIESGLRALRSHLATRGKISVALPALGCGHGGLNWRLVSEMIKRELSGLEAEIHVFSPGDSLAIGKSVSEGATA